MYSVRCLYKSNILFSCFSIDIPRIDIEREETPDGSQCFTAHIESIPAAYQAEWKMKRNNDDSFKPVDVNADEFRGTLNTLPHPVLVIKQKKQLEIYRFNIEVDNFVGSCRKGIAGKIPIKCNLGIYFQNKKTQR